MKNKTKIIISVSIILISVAGFFGVKYFNRKNNNKKNISSSPLIENESKTNNSYKNSKVVEKEIKRLVQNPIND